MIVFKTDSPI